MVCRMTAQSKTVSPRTASVPRIGPTTLSGLASGALALTIFFGTSCGGGSSKNANRLREAVVVSQAFREGGQDYYVITVRLAAAAKPTTKLEVKARYHSSELKQRNDSTRPGESLWEIICDLRTLAAGEHVLSVELGDSRVKGWKQKLSFTVVKEMKLIWNPYYKVVEFKCPSDRCKGDLNTEYGVLSVSGEAGTEVTFLEEAKTLGRESTTWAIDVQKAFGSAAKSLASGASLSLPIRFRFKDGGKLSDQVVVKPQVAIRLVAGHFAGGRGLRFGSGDEASGPPRTLLLIGADGTSRVFGKGSRFADVDLVARLERKTRSRSCGSYRHRGTGKIERISNEAHDAHITVHDRRTGKKVASKVIATTIPPCAKKLAGYQKGVANSANEADGYAFLKSLVVDRP